MTAAPAEIEEEIFDEDVPLADIPHTGDSISVWGILMVLSGAAALCTVAAKRKVNG